MGCFLSAEEATETFSRFLATLCISHCSEYLVFRQNIILDLSYTIAKSRHNKFETPLVLVLIHSMPCSLWHSPEVSATGETCTIQIKE